MLASELKVGDIFRKDEEFDNGAVYECTGIITYHVVAQDIYTLKEHKITKGTNVVVLEKEEESEVHNPQRYNANNVECWDFINKYDLDYFVATAIKYVWRHKYKDGKQDLEKALEFLNKRISLEKIYSRPNNFEYTLPNVIDYQDMDLSQMVILYYASRLHVVPVEAQIELVKKIKCLVEDYINELY